MKLVTAKLGPFRSMNTAQTLAVGDGITVLVGMNEAGKTVILKALEKSTDALGIAKFDPVDDYPRKELSAYLKKHTSEPATATELSFRLTDSEVAEANKALGTQLTKDFEFSVSYKFDNKIAVSLTVSEEPVLQSLQSRTDISSDAKTALKKANSLRDIPAVLTGEGLTEADQIFLKAISERIGKSQWPQKPVLQWEAWEWLKQRTPQFLYFSDYDLLPSKSNLADLAQRAKQAESDPKRLTPSHRAVLALLRMADIELNDFTSDDGYEPLKAKLEGVSISLTDQIMEFWKQNEDLEVEVDIKEDKSDEAPFNNGPNLYLRIKNRRHRGVSTPFQQRSRGFIWFFSFLVWFDSVHHQIGAEGTGKRDLILLLDEPGLALHALAQSDFLRYIDDLSTRHQVLYTTHSPFMIHSNRLHEVRVVEDRDKVGTVISENLGDSDARTIFPLQAALGWTVAQNLFITEKNLLVEGPSELLYLKLLSSLLEKAGRKGLREDVTIVPVGGLDKVATFVALLGANRLKMAVLHDYSGSADQRLSELVRQKLIAGKAILNASQFRDLSSIGTDGKRSDIEDLFEVTFYLEQFAKTFASKLSGKAPTETTLPPGDRVVERLERWLNSEGVQLRATGGFNHYLVASFLSGHPPDTLSPDTMARFEAFFGKVNSLLA